MILLDNLEDSELEKIKREAPIFALFQAVGKYNYIIYAITEDINSFCQEFLSSEHFQIYPIISSIPDNYNPFDLQVKHPEPIKEDKKLILDKKDYKLLYHLSKSPLSPTIKLSEETGLDPKTIKLRIEKMIDANLIQKIRFAANIFKIGVTAYFVKLDIIPKNKQKILTTIRANNYSGFVYETHTGFFLWYMPPSHAELFEFTKTLEHLDKTIKIDAMQSVDILKIETVPKAVLEIFKQKYQ
ncbi:Lrp/AsnC family transcriptional regulator [archaeon]|jgi:DNA-binding Lrp family transcriptional regulator|nr:Lrp/AsnC family transcriptional regulator [archaeon]MBT7128822.1 Lrp/AsnC family transcriptional regulator [archaeon]